MQVTREKVWTPVMIKLETPEELRCLESALYCAITSIGSCSSTWHRFAYEFLHELRRE